MHKDNPKFFFEFAKAWPGFLRNTAMLNQLTKVDSQKVLVADQSEMLSILSKQNVLHPDLLKVHFEMFLKMSDKEMVAKYLK